MMALTKKHCKGKEREKSNRNNRKRERRENVLMTRILTDEHLGQSFVSFWSTKDQVPKVKVASEIQ